MDKERRLFPGLDYYVTELGGAPVWTDTEQEKSEWEKDEEDEHDWFGSRDEYFRLPWHDIDIGIAWTL